MLDNATISKLNDLGLFGMVSALNDQFESTHFSSLSFEERLGLLVDCEIANRDSKRLISRLKGAKLRHNATIEDINFHSNRSLNKALIMNLGSSQWVNSKQNILITGPTGVGKSYLACALAHSAIRNGHTAVYKLFSRLLRELAIAKADGRYHRVLCQLLRSEVLIIDDFCLTQLKASETMDLMEVIEDRSERRSTIVTSQLPIKQWHQMLSGPTIADAILDRLIHNSHTINLTGESMRKVKNQKVQQ